VISLSLVGMLRGQPEVTKHVVVEPGEPQEVVVHVPPRQIGDFLDILTTGPKLNITLILPDGQSLTQTNAEKLGYPWDVYSKSRLEEMGFPPDTLISGPGEHTLISIPEEAQSGDYRVGIDPGKADTASQAGIQLISFETFAMKAFSSIPGVKVTKPVRVRPGSTNTTLEFTLAESTGNAELDIAPTDPRVKVSLRFPDGTRVSKNNAQAAGISWEATEWPPRANPGDEWAGLGELFALASMLPIRGTHQFITFTGGVQQRGRYVIEVDARGVDRPSAIRAMFLPSTYVNGN